MWWIFAVSLYLMAAILSILCYRYYRYQDIREFTGMMHGFALLLVWLASMAFILAMFTH